MSRKRVILLLLVVVLALLMVAATKFTDISLGAGEGARVSCSTGIVTAYVDDGMAVVECHAPAPFDRRK